MTRRGGRARLNASDSKSDRGVSPSGVQILSPPPFIFAVGAASQGSAARRSGSDRRSGFAGLRGSTVGRTARETGRSGGEQLLMMFGGVTERPKVRHWKCRARVIPVPRVQIPPPPPLLIRRRSACAGLRRSTVGQRPPWSLRRSTVGR